MSVSRSDQQLSSGLSGSQFTQESQSGELSIPSRDNYGYIESLTISNFKSYYGETVIGPFSPFTCIIGPNGSGKSNLMDAISFVLGIKTQQLRGKKLTDLIHRINFSQNSNKSQQSSNQQQPTKAYVELIYISKKIKQSQHDDDDDIDSQQQQQPNDQETEFEEERLVFTRTITENGSTINQFNHKRLDFKKYEEELSKIGVIVRARNFLVFQGDVTNIAQKTGKQLTKWFEQISGSDAHKTDYEAARKEQEQIQNRFEGLTERNRNLAREKKQMKQQKDEATQYQTEQKELMDLKSEYYRFQLYHIITDVRAARDDIENAEINIKEGNEGLKDLEDEIKLKQADLSKSLRKKGNITKNLKKMRQSLNKKKLKKDGLEKEFAALKEEENALDVEEEKLDEVMEGNNEKLIDLKEEMDDLEEKRKEYEEELKNEADDIELEENQYEIYRDVKKRICQETAALNIRKGGLRDIYIRKKDGFDALENEVNVLLKREEKLEGNMDGIKENINKIENDLKRIDEEYKVNKKELVDMNGKREKLDKERVVINNKLEKLFDELKEMDIGIRDSAKEQEQMEVLQTLQKLFSGIYGKLCDLIDVRQKRFQLAVAVGLGINHNAVIVENKQIAIQCMEHMRKTRRGHFRFIPLADIKTVSVSQALRRFGGTAQPMMDVVNYEPQFERAVEFALSNTIVVDGIDEARDIAYGANNNNNNNNNGQQTQRIRIVSLDGSVIQPNGNISGGYSRDFKDKARRFTVKERGKKIRIRDDLIQKLKDIDDELMGDDDHKSNEELENILNELDNNRKNKRFRIEIFKKQLLEKEEMINSLRKDLKIKRLELKKEEKEVNFAKKELDELDEEIIGRENEIFDQYAEELGVSTIREYEEQKLQRIEERSERKKEFNVELTELENKYKFIEQKNVMNKDEIKKMKQRLKKLRNEMKDIENKKLMKLNKEIEKEEKNTENEEKKSDDIHKDCKNKRKIVGDKKKEIDEKRKEIQDKMREKSKLKGWIVKLSETQKNILQQAKHEQVELKSKKQLKSKKKKAKNKKKVKKKKGGHRRKRRKKNDGDSSDEEESDDYDEEEEEEEDEGEEEHKTDDEDLSDNDAMDEDEYDDDDDDDIDIEEIMERRLVGIDLNEFDEKKEENNNNDRMDEDVEDEEDEEEEEKKGDEFEYEVQKKRYLSKIEELRKRLNELQPNMKALKQYKSLQNKWKNGSNEQKQFRKKVSIINNRVDKIIRDRSEQFTECFEIIQKNIKKIYGALTSSRQYKTGGRAFLNIGGAINPFEDEIVFNAMPPGKPFREMQQLSGGEKSVASLALLFAIHSYKPSPFFILDEIDAALDQKNVQRVCNYIQRKAIKNNTQIIVISLKDKFFKNAHSLIGVCKNRKNGSDSSQVLSIDLTKYDNNNNNNNNNIQEQEERVIMRRRRIQKEAEEDDEKQQNI